GSARRIHHPVAHPIEYAANQHAYGKLVLHEENGFTPLQRGIGAGRPLRRALLHLRLDTGKIDAEGGAHAQLALDPDISTALLDDAVDRAQSQAGSLPLLLGGKEGFEHTVLKLPAHPDAIVAHFEENEAA